MEVGDKKKKKNR